MFGTTLLIALLCGLLCLRLHWYRTATWMTALLCLDIALLMILGAGERGHMLAHRSIASLVVSMHANAPLQLSLWLLLLQP